MIKSLFWLALAVMVTSGCGQQDQAPAQTHSAAPPAPSKALPSLSSESGTAAPPPAPAAAVSSTAPQAVATPVASQAEGVDVEQLSIVVGAYYGETKKKPTSLKELVAGGFLPKEPVPPQGQAFVIDPETLKVKLVSR